MKPCRFRQLMFLSIGLGLLAVAPAWTQPKESKTEAIGKKWALIVGINYEDAQAPQLRNPEKDAQRVHDVLVKHYGYEKDKTVQLVLGKHATGANLRKLLGNDYLGDPAKIQPEDSVLFYFAGHGERLVLQKAREPVGALLPFDTNFQLSKPVLETVVRFQEDLVALLQECPARHKLIVLDCCHSGEIFSRAVPRSEVDPRRAKALFSERSLQAVASCRAVQTASDGSADRLSPFTTALLKGLHTLPVSPGSQDFSEFFTVTDLFKFVRTEFIRTNTDGQSPDLRNLTASDGEFRFFPQKNSGFEAYRPKQLDFKLLQAMVPGEYGNWWFQEVPWLIPSLRQAILDKTDDRRSGYVQAMSRRELLKAARKAREHLVRFNETKQDALIALRLRHLDALLDGERTPEFRAVVKKIADDLAELTIDLEAVDLHLLAVLKHALDAPDTEERYKKALRKYKDENADDGEADKGSRDRLALQALCYSDRGNYRFQVLNRCEEASRDFRKVWELFGTKDSPPPFQIFILCREADALQRLGRWGLADRRFEEALAISGGLDPKNTTKLTAHVISRRGWANMEQWRFAKAAEAFRESSRIIEREPSDPAQKPLHQDPEALILWFHNKHGLAMARRFQGDTQGAVAAFRQLTVDLAKSFKRLGEDQTLALQSADIKINLTNRWVNSMERLIDANLLSDAGDFREAHNDLRSSLRYTYVLPERSRKPTEAGLLYKQAILLSLRTPVQDLELAQISCNAAKEIEKTLDPNQQSLLDFPRQLAPVIVALFKSAGDKPPFADARKKSLAELRGAIESLRDRWQHSDHRDHLEWLMFANKILLVEAVDADRYETFNDAEMLLGFCRRALRSPQREALPYLRPFYDLAMGTKLRLNPKHVKDLLEVQWEATEGTPYLQQPLPLPTLALYFLNGQAYLLVDVPRGLSKSFVLDDDYSVERLARCIEDKKTLPLPREVERELVRFASANAKDATIRFYWHDPVLLAHLPSSVARPSSYAGLPAIGLPFALPPGIRMESSAGSTSVAEAPMKE